jgi:hypothetical protein
LIVLDDFYHVPYEDQPDVLAYLHQVVKNLNISSRSAVYVTGCTRAWSRMKFVQQSLVAPA